MKPATRRGLLGLAAASAAALAVGSRVGPAAAVVEGSQAVTVKATPFETFSLRDESLRRFGQLDFVGGLELSCADERFGGWSSLWVDADGRRFISISDKGTWLSGVLACVGETPLGITDAHMAPVLGPTGRPVSRTRRWDCESLAIGPDGVAYVGLERVNEVLRFGTFPRDRFAAAGQPIPVPPPARKLADNRGLEALAIIPSGPLGGSLIGVAERPEGGKDGPVSPGFFITGPASGAVFDIVRHDGFDITDAAFLPSGDLLLLERRFAWLSGVAMRVRRFDGKALRPGARLDGDPLISATMAMRIDNMEGLAVHRGADGGTYLTMISDDNFSVLQRTVMLRFRLVA